MAFVQVDIKNFSSFVCLGLGVGGGWGGLGFDIVKEMKRSKMRRDIEMICFIGAERKFFGVKGK